MIMQYKSTLARAFINKTNTDLPPLLTLEDVDFSRISMISTTTGLISMRIWTLIPERVGRWKQKIMMTNESVAVKKAMRDSIVAEKEPHPPQILKLYHSMINLQKTREENQDLRFLRYVWDQLVEKVEHQWLRHPKIDDGGGNLVPLVKMRLRLARCLLKKGENKIKRNETVGIIFSIDVPGMELL